MNEKENKRTIDYERNIIFKHIGTKVFGPGEGPNIARFVITINDAEIPFIASEKIDRGKHDKAIMHWGLHLSSIPKNLPVGRDEFIAIISEALHAYGHVYSRDNIEAVHLDFFYY